MFNLLQGERPYVTRFIRSVCEIGTLVVLSFIMGMLTVQRAIFAQYVPPRVEQLDVTLAVTAEQVARLRADVIDMKKDINDLRTGARDTNTLAISAGGGLTLLQIINFLTAAAQRRKRDNGT